MRERELDALTGGDIFRALEIGRGVGLLESGYWIKDASSKENLWDEWLEIKTRNAHLLHRVESEQKGEAHE